MFVVFAQQETVDYSVVLFSVHMIFILSINGQCKTLSAEDWRSVTVKEHVTHSISISILSTLQTAIGCMNVTLTAP